MIVKKSQPAGGRMHRAPSWWIAKLRGAVGRAMAAIACAAPVPTRFSGRIVVHPIIEALRTFLRRDDGAHGAKHTLLTGLIASAVVLTASLFGQDFASLMNEASCNASPRCAIRVAGDKTQPAMGAGAAGQVVAVEATPTPVSRQQASREAVRDR